ncbi:MAG: Ig-like domain-containing protein [Clostridia bacterium]|nr:Ig-like domain-containing protein [Clostridia bacterium]
MKKLLTGAVSIILILLTLISSVVITSATQLFGDVDNDGNINSADALIILQVSVGEAETTDEIRVYGDLNADGVINSTDALFVLQKSVGTPIKVEDFSLNMTEKTVTVGATVQLEAFDFKPKVADNTQVEWLSSDDSVATVDKNGLVKTFKPGKVTVTASSADAPEIQKSVLITVAPLISSVKAEKTAITLAQGSQYNQKLTFTPADVANKTMSWTSSDKSIATVDENGTIKALKIGTATITGTTTDGTKKTVSCKVTVTAMSIPYVSQMPKYPTGCEAASCCMILKYYGFSINMDQMVEAIPRKNLYKKNGKWYGPDINEMFVGDPRGYYTSANPGYGAFSPVVTKSLQNVVDERGGGYTAVKISGCSFKELLGYVSDGHPVIVWATYKMQNPTKVNSWYIESTGKYFEYPRGTHVMILSGYSSTTVTTVDPYDNGVLTFDIKKFEDRWNLLGKQGVILVKNK